MSSEPLVKSRDIQFKLKPVSACVRIALAGGMLAGHGAALAELPVPAASWVTSGSATSQVIGNTLQIHQTTDKAILNWQKFNVGKDNTVKFVQPGTSSIALNRINDQNPSEILGQIIANGQVYLYNKNGFIFGEKSVVNTNSFIASTLNITDEVFERGITRVYDENKGAALVIEPKQEGDTLDPKNAEILIKAGAKITTDKAGRIIIAAPRISNEGSLAAGTQGQIVLAASEDKVYLQAADDKSPFAGLLVEVGTGGKVTNAGDISVRQGNVTLAGFAVNQQGRVSATTSVNVNGSVRLIAREKIKDASTALVGTSTTREEAGDDGLGVTAEVKLGSGSVTEVVADASGGSAIDEQERPASYVELGAHTVALESGSTIRAPGATVVVNATDNPEHPELGTSGRIHVADNAKIDVSGYKDVKVAMERNVGEISVQSYELRDSPLQRTGVLKGKKVLVDLRKGSDIVDVSGAEARIGRGVQERLGKGGSIKLTSSGDVIANDGSRFDVSGGSVQYQGGYVKTTKLVTSYGKVVDISDADSNETYSDVFGVVEESHAKWGVSKTWDLLGLSDKGRYESGYSEGLDSGTLTVSTPRLAWGGTLAAGSVSGQLQRSIADIAANGQFVIDLAVFKSGQNVRFVDPAIAVAVAVAAGGEFPQLEGKTAELQISAKMLRDSGLGGISVKTLGDAAIDGVVAMQPGGSLSIEATNIAVNGGFNAAGGKFSLKTDVIAVDDSEVDVANLGKITVAAGATVDVSGRWVNDLKVGLGNTPTERLYIDGGSVAIRGEGDVSLEAGAKISADGGAWLQDNGNWVAGSGGNITLAAEGSSGGSLISTLTLDGEVSAYGLSQNGVLNLTSGKIVVGGPDSGDDVADALILGTNDGSFDLSRQLAFREINLNADYGTLLVKGNVDLNLRQRNLELKSGYQSVESDRAIRQISRLVELSDDLRKAVKFSLTGTSSVKLETGSRIVTDTGSKIELTSTAGSVYVDGTLQTVAGYINLAIVPNNGVQYDPGQAIWLGQNASLDAKGSAVFAPADIFGFRQGNVLDGGEINFDAKRGVVVVSSGATLDVSGIQATVDIPQTEAKATRFIRQAVASNGGKIAFKAADGIVINGEMRAYAGSSTVHGGRLFLNMDRSELNRPELPVVPFPSGPLLMNVTQSGRRQFESDLQFGDDFPGDGIGIGNIGADQIAAGGFTELNMAVNGSLGKASVVFVGDVNLNLKERIRIDAAEISAIGIVKEAGEAPATEDPVVVNPAELAGNIVLNAAYIEFGSSRLRDIATGTESGSGKLSANAQWIQLTGSSVWKGFQDVALNSEHDIRTVGVREESDEQRDYVGSLVTAGNLHLSASQIYPSTLTDFTFAVRGNPKGNIVISGKNTDATPLAAAGSLTFEAPAISQQGVVKAPFGSITFKAAERLTVGGGSLTTVSGIDRLTATELLIPFGVVQGGTDWLYPLDGLRNLVWNAAQEKRIVMNAPEIEVARGSVVDLAGGGDLLAYEFIPGAGGSYDYLLPGSASYQGGFAILPKLATQLAPFDHYESGAWNHPLGSTVYLQGIGGLPAGEYTILPARYALLDGAYLITPLKGTQDLALAQTTPDGRAIVSGYFAQAGTGIRDARTSGFLVETGADVRRRSEYQTYTANEFYKAQAKRNETALPTLPMDGGQISLIAQTRLLMNGQFMMQAQPGGRGAQMDVAANKIRIVNEISGSGNTNTDTDMDSETEANPDDGVLQILAGDLSNLNVESLLLGGSRDRNNQTGETELAVTAENVVFAEGISLSGGEILAAAKNLVEVREGVSLDANRKISSADSVLNIAGNGAFLRVSGAKQIELNRTETDGSTGDLKIAEGSSLHASWSMVLDAAHATELKGDIRMEGGSLNLAANSVNLGNVEGLEGEALNLTNAKLAQLNVDELVLTARDSIGFYGGVDWSGERLAINAAGFTGHGKAGEFASVRAGTLALSNSAAASNSQLADGTGKLALIAERIEIGDGNFAIQGFSDVALTASEQIRATGNGSWRIAGNLAAVTAGFGADGGASLNLDVSGHSAKILGVVSDKSILSGYGAKLAITADNIDFDSKVLLPSGSLKLHAMTGGLNLGEHAQIDLAGRAVKFGDVERYTSGGRFEAAAEQGGIAMAAGSTVDVSKGGGGAAGGNLNFRALQDSTTLDGRLLAQEGSAVLELGKFAQGQSFDTLAEQLNAAGVDQAIYLRIKTGDIVQSQSGKVKAEQLTLAADAGSIELAGISNADSTDGGSNINLYAGDKVVLAAGARLLARGTGDGATGGAVLLSTVDDDGDGVSGIEMRAGSSIDVGGNGAEGGDVTLRALRDGNGIRVQPIAGNVSGYKTFYAEGVAKYSNADLGDDGRIDVGDIANIKQDTDQYMSAANMVAVESRLGQGVRLLPGIEIDYHGDLVLKDKWDLADWRYDENTDDNVWDDVPGRLTIRTDGNFRLDQSLSDGFKDVNFQYDNGDETTKSISIIDKLQSGDSWSYRLSAGADLAAADPGKTAYDKDLTLTSNVKVRTGTGDIQMQAGGDIIIAGGESVDNRLGAAAVRNSKILAVSNASAWKAGGYLSGSGIAAGTYITGVDAGNVTHYTSASAINRSLSLRLNDVAAQGWKVGDYLSGNGLAAGTAITDILTSGAVAQTTAAAAKNATSVKVADVSRWAVGDYLTGNGVAADTQITAINATTKTVTLNKALTGAVSTNSALRTLPSVHLSVATTKIINANTELSTLATVSLSQALTAQINSNTKLTASYTPASIYSAGTTTQSSPYGSLADRAVALFFYNEYPVGGGNVTLAAGGNVQGTVSGNDYNDWLLRIGEWSVEAQIRPTAWGVALGYIPGVASTTQPGKATMPLFQQNVGAFGGGKVDVNAGGDINDLEVVMPTTGKQVGDAAGSLNLNGFQSNQVVVDGGGQMAIQAGGNIKGGTFYLGQGKGALSAGGAISGGSQYVDGPVLLMGASRFGIAAGGNVSLSGVTDPMIAHSGNVNFYSYAANSALQVASLAGGISLHSNLSKFIPKVIPQGTANQQSLAAIYPATLDAAAFGGSIEVADEIVLFPSVAGVVNLLAEQNVSAESLTDRLGVSDADPAIMPEKLAPLARTAMKDLAGALDPFGSSPLVHSAMPVHSGDSQPVRLVTRSGDIHDIVLTLPSKVLVDSGHDIRNLALTAQHANTDDVSLIQAARDIRFSSERNANGALLDNDGGIEIGGSGEVLAKAGRHIDLGASNGISTTGDVINPNLADQGANLTALAGANGELDYAGFIKAYMMGDDARSQKARTLVVDFMRQRTGNISLNEADALSAFAELNSGDFVAIQPKLNAALLPAFFDVIRESGSASAADKSAGNQAAYDAIEQLFPGSDWQGDLRMVFSKMNTLDGGDINLLVPGGEVNVGLAVSFAGAKPASELGIVVQRSGSVNALVRDNFQVNTSRVFALDGGDIMIWSSDGDIDAGRGAKSAISAPPPKISFDEKGNMVIEFPPVVSGSGIRTAASSEGVKGGDVYLFAPKGVVDAGEAGIAGTNVTISATAVLGAQNIQVGGVGVGVPVASVGSVAAGLTGTSNLSAGVSQMAESSVGNDVGSKSSMAAMAKAILGILSVDILGFGD